MSTNNFSIKYLQSGGLITNYYCSSKCRHCLYRCSPLWPKEYISPETTKTNLQKIKNLGCPSIHIGGGEPLLNIDALIVVLKIAFEMGIHIEYVETNASWYRDYDSACDILEKLRSQRLSTLLISISPFHNEFIPFYKTKGVIEACQDLGIGVFPWITAFIDDINRFDEKYPHKIEEYQDLFGADYLKDIPSRYWITHGGRALETFAEISDPVSIPEMLECNSNCRELSETSHFHIDLYGNYIPGLCSGLSIKQEDLSLELNPDKYPIITRLYSGGIAQLYSYAQNQYNFNAQKTEYASKCELCYEIRRFLVVESDINSIELCPAEHYTIN